MTRLQVSEQNWRKSSYSGGAGTDCVEVAAPLAEQAVLARDSKNPHGGTLRFSARHWSAFLADVKAGRFDRA
jgi:hypothetical protein